MDNALQELSNSEKILIYGAVKIAREAALLIEYLFPGKLIGFAVTSMVGNMDNIYGLSVKSIEEYFKQNTSHCGAHTRDKIIKNNLMEYKCAICGNIGEWNGKQLVLQLDHINGDHFDNRLENLRFLCPNCHSQTETFGSKNYKE